MKSRWATPRWATSKDPYDVEEADRVLHAPAPELVGRLQPGLVAPGRVAQEDRGDVDAVS
jgi:hypothetical protein